MKTSIQTGLAAVMILAISCTKEPLRNSQTTSIQTGDKALQVKKHYIGEKFGGGIVFLVTKDSLHGGIADTVDLQSIAWRNGAFTITGAIGTKIGTGRANTRKIIASQGTSGNYAALECSQLIRGVYTDWVLPSKDELDSLYKHKMVVGHFHFGLYWSSSEYDSVNAWVENFADGTIYSIGNKDDSYYVRAVRAF